MPPLRHHHLNAAVAVMEATAAASAAASPSSGNNFPIKSRGGNEVGDILGVAGCGHAAVLMGRVADKRNKGQG
jgi:hypothetical protein